MNLLAANLKMLRLQHGLTQKQVADALNIERSTYTYYERGRTLPTFSTIQKLARIFDVSIDTMAGVDLQNLTAPAEENVFFGDESGNTHTLHQNSYSYIYQHSSLAALPEEEQALLLKFRQLPSDKKEDLVKQLNRYIDELDME